MALYAAGSGEGVGIPRGSANHCDAPPAASATTARTVHRIVSSAALEETYEAAYRAAGPR